MHKINKFDLLVSIYVFCICVSELMGAKTFPIINFGWLHLNASVAIFVIPLMFTINDVIVEVYGKERALSVVRSGFIVVFLILAFSVLVTLLPPSVRFKESETAYDNIFGKSARIAAASLTAFVLSELIDVAVFYRLKKKMGKKALWFRNNASNFISQFADTLIFITLAFWAFDKPFLNNLTFLTSLIVPYWMLKCSLSVLETPLVYLGVSWLKKDRVV